MSHQLLDIFDVEQDFFAKSKLFALGSRLPAYSFCSLLNSLFAIHLCKEADIKIVKNVAKPKPTGMSNLFASYTEEAGGQENLVDFQLFRYAYDCQDEEDISLLIYENQNQGFKLIPELPHADYLMLIQNSARIRPESDVRPYLNQLVGLDWVSEIDPYGLRSRSNLLL